MHDMLGINTAFKPRFLRQYLNMAEQIESAVKGYITDIKSGDFPNASESY
jgi:3-methyl-2-oxobutanoate hydroxymethyltransferase